MYMKEKNTRSWRILQIEKQGQKTIDAIIGESKTLVFRDKRF